MTWSYRRLPLLLGAENPGQPALTKHGMSVVREALRDLRKNHPGLEYMTALLQKAKSEVARDGYISLLIRNRIFHAFRGWDYIFASLFLVSGPPKAKKEDRPSDRPSEKVADGQAVDKQTDKERSAFIAALIDHYLEKIGELKRHVTEREDLARDAEARSFSLPPADAADKLLRYETHLDRQLYRDGRTGAPTAAAPRRKRAASSQHQSGRKEITFFAKQSQEVPCFQSTCNRGSAVILPGSRAIFVTRKVMMQSERIKKELDI